MRVVVDATAVHSTSGGAGTYLRALVANLPSAGVDPIVVARRNDETEWVGASDVRRIAPDQRVLRLVWEQTHLGREVDRLRQRAPIVLHSPHYTTPHRLNSAIARAITIHDLTFFSRPQDHDRSKRLMFRSATRYAAQHGDALICVSNMTERALRDAVTVDAPVVVAPHGVDLHRFRPLAEFSEVERTTERDVLKRLGVECPFVLHLGTIEPRKRVAELIEAVSKLSISNLQLVLAGQLWPSLAATFPKPLPFERRLGFVDDDVVPVLLRNAIVVVYPSAEEGFGLPVLEALASGTRVITTPDTSMAELAGDAADYVDSSQPLVSELTKILARVVAQAPGADEVRHRRERAEGFSWSNCAIRHVEAYEVALRVRRERSV
jgi:glycosyltransferase involved in cell wall biosynthesis